MFLWIAAAAVGILIVVILIFKYTKTGLAIIMMAKPDSDMEGTICKNCQRPINDHLPEELEECVRILELQKLKDGDLT